MPSQITSISGRVVIGAQPYAITAEDHVKATAEIGAQAIKQLMLLHQMDRPFEVAQLRMQLTAKNHSGALLNPQPTILDRLIRARLWNISTNVEISKSLVFAYADGVYTWTPEEHFLLWRGEGLECAVVATEAFHLYNIESILVRLSLEGVALMVAPPSLEERPHG